MSRLSHNIYDAVDLFFRDEQPEAFAAVRVIANPAHRELPIAAMLGFQADGAVAQSLFRNPSQIPSLMRLASDAVIAFRALLRGRGTLGPHFGSSPCTELESRFSATAIENPERFPASTPRYRPSNRQWQIYAHLGWYAKFGECRFRDLHQARRPTRRAPHRRGLPSESDLDR